jgi:ribonucleotide monophosphatase NagD (HAD superfamily)
MLERASGVQGTYMGKPFPFAIELTLRSMGLERAEVAMVGDRISTDILGAASTGLTSVLVKTGEFQAVDLQGPVRPSAVVDRLMDLPACLDLFPS